MKPMLLEGLGAAARWPEFLAAYGVHRPLVVAGKRFYPLAQGLAGAFFSGYHPNPELKDALAGAALFKAQGCDCLVSIGGGSAMDTAKAVKYHLNQPSLPHLAIPATAGTGSEATRFAVVYVNGRKRSLDLEWLLPEAALLDGKLLATLPDYHKRACLMDALAQGIESYWAKAASAESRAIAAQAICGVLEALEGYLAGEEAAAQAMLKAAYLSGQAIAYTRTTAPHAMSYALTGRYGIAHGHAVGLTLPYVWQAMIPAPALTSVWQDLTRLLGGGPPTLHALMARLGLTPPPQALGDDLEALVASVDIQRLGNHPVAFTAPQLRALYAQALGVAD